MIKAEEVSKGALEQMKEWARNGEWDKLPLLIPKEVAEKIVAAIMEDQPKISISMRELPEE